MIENPENEINYIKKETKSMKKLSLWWGKKIKEINQQIKSSKTVNIAKIVELVVSFLDNPKPSEKSFTAANEKESDICNFESENKKQRISHMREEHADCHCCSLKHQNQIHP